MFFYYIAMQGLRKIVESQFTFDRYKKYGMHDYGILQKILDTRAMQHSKNIINANMIESEI